jgi:hypothetical protein
VNRESVSSSTLASVGYDESSSTLEVEFLNGAIYQYFDVPVAGYHELIQAGSVGRYFSQNIRNAFRYARV